MTGRGLRCTWILVTLVSTGCAASPADRTPIPTVTLIPYRSSTPTSSPTGRTATVEPVTTPAPTPTPLTHIVQEDETLLGIAAQYGITLDQLLLANPGIVPRLLSIGQPILIPGPEGTPVAVLAPTPTPVSVAISPAACYRTLSDGLWCMAIAEGLREAWVEGLSVMVTLLDDRGHALTSSTAHAPLDRLEPGGILPLVVYFPPPAPAAVGAAITPLSGIQVGEVSERYPPVVVERATHEPDPGRRWWRVQGQLSFTGGANGGAAEVTVVLLAIGPDERPVGYRVWEAAVDPASGNTLEFDLTVYSLGPEIERVELAAEARVSE